MAAAGLQASLSALDILARKGLVSPTEITGYLDGISKTLERMPRYLDHEISQKFDEWCSGIVKAAKENWKGE
jgi:hypothetical protein